MITVRTHEPSRIYEFDDFQLYPDERRLLHNGEPVPLQGRAFEVLLVLVENRGRLLTKDELFEMVWPGQIVEESNLTVNMSAVRRALGERAKSPRLITTFSGRGYRFTGDVREVSGGEEELTVEHETFTRVVVEQEEIESAETEATCVVPSQPSRTVGRLSELNGLSTSIAAQARARKEEESPARTQLRAPLLFALCGALLLAGVVLGIRFYQSQSRERARRATGVALPSQQLTLRRFDAHGGVPFRVAISPDGRQLAYMQRVNGKDSLWLGQVESNSSVPINQQPNILYQALVFSPDGGSLYLTVLDLKRGETKLVRMPVVGGVMTELAKNVSGSVTFSPDGQRLAFLRRDEESKQTSIIIADSADGGNERTLVARHWPENFSGQGLAWSPDGKRIVVGANKADGAHSELLAVGVEDDAVERIGSREWGVIGNLAWLPDGGGLVVSNRESAVARRSQIWLVPYPEGEARKITNDLNVYLTENLSLSANGRLALLQGHITSDIRVAPDGDARRARLAFHGVEFRYEGIDGLAWTPDGQLLYSAYVGDGQAIWEINRDGGDLQQLTANVAASVDRQMSVTADGRYMIFQSDRSGSFEIWRANADGSDLKQLTTDGNNSQPSLSPDGQWIVYASMRGGRAVLKRISIDGGEPTQLTEGASSWPQVSPDGKLIAYDETSDPQRIRLAVIPFDGGEAVKVFAVPGTVYLARPLRWTPDGKAILYKDSVQGLWRQSLDENVPQPVKGFEDVQVFQFAFSPDGKSLAYTSGAQMQEIILMENLRSPQ